MADSSRGGQRNWGLCTHSRESPEGAVELTWKAWGDGDDSLRWELRRILPSLGYTITQKYKVKDVVRDMLQMWKDTWEPLHIGKELFGRPRASSSWKEDHAGENYDEQEFWVLTEGLIPAILAVKDYRRSMANKRRVRVVLELWLDKVLTADEVRGLQFFSWEDQDLAQCQEGVSDGLCRCVQRVEQEITPLRVGSATPRQQLLGMLEILFKLRACPAVIRMLRRLVCGISHGACRGMERWSSDDLAGAVLMGPSGRKRMRVDPHHKQSQLDSVASTGAASSKADLALVAGWMEERMRWRVAANHLAMAQPAVWSSCFDAGRVGKPSKELLLHNLFHHGVHQSVPLPPRVLRCRIWDCVTTLGLSIKRGD